MNNSKTDLRNHAKEIRKNLSIARISEILTEKVRQTEIYQNSKNVMIYYPTSLEINLLGLLNDDKNFYLPKVDKENLLVCPYESTCKLVKSNYNIYEPCTNPVFADILDLVIVPALMVDVNGYRLGYGKGFYDRFLSGKSLKTLCAIPKELYIKTLPRDEFDVPIDVVITT